MRVMNLSNQLAKVEQVLQKKGEIIQEKTTKAKEVITKLSLNKSDKAASSSRCEFFVGILVVIFGRQHSAEKMHANFSGAELG